MAYTKVLWQNSPSTATPMNAQNLNHMDDGIAENDRRLNELSTAGVVNTFNSRTGNVTSEKGDYDIDQIVASDGQDGYIPVWRNSGTEQEPDWGFAMEEMGGSGHEILDADGTSMAQEDALQFADAFLTDDSVNGRTVVENVKEVSPADYATTTDEGIIVCDDGDDAVIGAVSDDYVEVTADGIKTYAQLLAELFNDVDTAKITGYTYISVIANYTNIFRFGNLYSGTYRFMLDVLQPNSDVDTTSITIGNTCSYINYDGTTYHDYSSNKPSNGTKITLYYGNKKAIVDLQTTANRCLYDSENTVKDVIDGSDITNLTCDNGTFGASHCVSVRGKMAYIEIVLILTDRSIGTTITVPNVNFLTCSLQAMAYQGWGATDQSITIVSANGNQLTIGAQTFPYISIMTAVPLV